MATLAQRRAAARARLSRSRGGRVLLGLGGRTGHLAMGAGIGAGAQILGQMLRDKVDFVKNNWYGEPLALGATAFLAVRRKPTWAYALAGAAGYSASFNYKLNENQAGRSPTSPVPVFTSGSAKPTSMYQMPGGAAAYPQDAVGF